MATETTLILFKTDCVRDKHCGEVLDRFEKEGFAIRGIKMVELSSELLTEHYAHVSDKPFFPEIVAFMQASPMAASSSSPSRNAGPMTVNPATG